MILIKLKAKNFRQYKDFSHCFPLSGIIAIVGDNEAGKSTLQEMMGFALFGTTALRTTVDKVLRFGSKDDVCEVEMEFKVGGRIYQLKRGFKGKNQSAYAEICDVEQSNKLLANNSKAVDGEVKRILGGIDYKVFYNTYCVKQKELDSLSAMMPSDRKRFVLRMLRIDVIDVAIKDIRAIIRDLESKISVYGDVDDDVSSIDKEIEELGNIIKEIDSRVEQCRLKDHEVRDALKNLKTEYEKFLDKYDAFKVDQRDIQSKLSEIDKEIQFIREERHDIGSKIESNRKMKEDMVNLEELESQYDEMLKQFQLSKELSKKQTSLRDKNIMKANIEGKIDKNKSDLDDFYKKMDSIDEELDAIDVGSLEDKLDDVKDKQLRIESKLSAKKDELKNIKNCIDILEKADGESVKCMYCGSEIHDVEHFRDELDKVESKIDELKEKSIKAKNIISKLNVKLKNYDDLKHRYDVYKKDISNYEENKKSLLERMEENEKSITDLSEEIKRIKDVGEVSDSSVNELKKKISYQKEIRASLKTHNELVEKYKTFKLRLESLKREYETFEFSDNKNKEKHDEFERVVIKFKEDIIKSEDDVKEKAQLLSDVQMEYHSNNMAYDNLIRKKKEVEYKKKSIEDMSNDLVKHTKLLNYFMDFKTNMMAQITPKLSEMLSDFVTNSSNRYSVVKINDDYDILVEMEGVEQPLKVLSGGAIDLVNACLRFSISRYLNESYGSLMNMIFMDEIFASQDVERRKNLINVMQSLKNIYKQIIIITHVNDVVDYVDEVITVVRDPLNGSYVK